MILCIFSCYLAVEFPNIGMRMISSFLIMLLGVGLLFGIDYKIGETKILDHNLSISDNYTTGIIEESSNYQYATYNNALLKGVGIIIILTGLLLALFRPLENYEGGTNEDNGK